MTYREYLTFESPSLAACQTRCGPYELLEPIGAGGMGAVYLARRSDGEVAQEVAVKILPLGEDDSDLREQFLGERQILASLSHPNIARLLDAGHTPGGQPYLVMELVRGVTLDVFCRGLSVRSRVSTFLSVCDAVAYAHRNLVVHRDLKPANILVDEAGHPKLLDFGVARLVQHDTGLTLAGCLPLTPDYASPEQVSGWPPATATDIYSLGALLYKLLTGRSPHQLQGKSPEAMAKAICHDEVIPASRFEPECKGDLDAILGKALRKEAHERYSTVEQLADDLRDYLASRPIRLRQDEAFYRLRRFVRRHRRTVAAATVVLVGLGVGLFVAERQRAIADRRFQEVRALANRLFDIDESLRTLPGVSDARQMIVDTSLEYLNQLSREAAGDPALMSDLATAYGRTASVLVWRSPISRPNLQQARDAEEKASVLLHTALARNPKDRAIFRHFVSNQRELISAYGLLRQTELSHTVALDLIHSADRFVAGSTSPEDFNAAAEAYLVAAQSPYGTPGADGLLERAISWRRRYAQEVNAPAARYSLAAAIRAFAVKLQDEGNLPQAADLLEEALSLSREVPRTTGLLRFQTSALISLGTVRGRVDRVSLGDSVAAVAPLLASIDLCRERIAGDPKNVEARIDFGWAATILGPVYALRDPQHALDLYREAIRTVSAVPKEEVMRPRYLMRLWSQSAIALGKLKRHEEAQRMVARIIRQLREEGQYPIRQVWPESPSEDLLRAQAETEAAAGNVAGAIRIREEMIREYRALKPQEHAELAHALAQSVQWRELTYLYRRSDRLAAARDAQNQRLELWRTWDRENPGNPFVLNQLAAARESDQF